MTQGAAPSSMLAANSVANEEHATRATAAAAETADAKNTSAFTPRRSAQTPAGIPNTTAGINGANRTAENSADDNRRLDTTMCANPDTWYCA